MLALSQKVSLDSFLSAVLQLCQAQCRSHLDHLLMEHFVLLFLTGAFCFFCRSFHLRCEECMILVNHVSSEPLQNSRFVLAVHSVIFMATVWCFRHNTFFALNVSVYFFFLNSSTFFGSQQFSRNWQFGFQPSSHEKLCRGHSDAIYWSIEIFQQRNMLISILTSETS